MEKQYFVALRVRGKVKINLGSKIEKRLTFS